jgi:hypothetical protein
LSGAHLRGTSFVYIAALFAALGGLTAATFNWASNLIVSLTFLTLVEKLGASSTFFLYALVSAASWLFAYYFVPETKGRTLEQIEAFWRARHHAHQTATQIF